jgi:hypothetical protein
VTLCSRRWFHGQLPAHLREIATSDQVPAADWTTATAPPPPPPPPPPRCCPLPRLLPPPPSPTPTPALDTVELLTGRSPSSPTRGPICCLLSLLQADDPVVKKPGLTTVSGNAALGTTPPDNKVAASLEEIDAERAAAMAGTNCDDAEEYCEYEPDVRENDDWQEECTGCGNIIEGRGQLKFGCVTCNVYFHMTCGASACGCLTPSPPAPTPNPAPPSPPAPPSLLERRVPAPAEMVPPARTHISHPGVPHVVCCLSCRRTTLRAG